MATRTKKILKFVPNVSTSILRPRVQNLFLTERSQNYYHMETVLPEKELPTFRNHSLVAKPNMSHSLSL